MTAARHLSGRPPDKTLALVAEMDDPTSPQAGGAPAVYACPMHPEVTSATTIYVGGQNSVAADGSLVGEGDVAAQSARALENAKTALAAAGAIIRDVVQWTVLFVDGVDIAAGYKAIASELASDEPALVTAARVAGLGVPGALVEIGVVAAVVR